MKRPTRTSALLALVAHGFFMSPTSAWAAGDLVDLGLLPGGTYSNPAGISANGSTVVGEADIPLFGEVFTMPRAFRWTQAEGMINLGTLNGGEYSYASGVSADGSIIVGTAGDGAVAQFHQRAFRWTTASGMVSLGTLNGGNTSSATAISANGLVIVGESQDNLMGGYTRAFRWTTGDGMVSLGTLNGGDTSSASAVSADGSVIVGNALDGPAGTNIRAFKWTAAQGMVSLGTLSSAPDSSATGVSADGNVIVGTIFDSAAGDRFAAFRWKTGEGMTDIGTLNGGSYAIANAVSADGQIIVGNASDGSIGNAWRGFRWSATGGMQSVEQWLGSNGVTVGSGLTTKSTTASNADGSIVTGQLANNHAYIARVSPIGSGLIDTTTFVPTLAASAHPQHFAISHADIVVHGLHGSPLRNLQKGGEHSVWVGGDLGRQDHFNNHGNTDAGEVGYAYGIDRGLTFKIALGRTYSDNRLIDDGDTTVHGAYVFSKLVYALPETPFHASASVYYNVGEARLRRAYVNAGSLDHSQGSADTQTSAVRLRLDWTNAFSTGSLTLSPYASVTQYRNRLAAFTESGGGFPVRWNSRSETHTQSRFGTDAVYDLGNDMNLIGRLETVHRFEGSGNTSTGEILGLGGFSFAAPENKRNWLRAGFGIEGKAGPGMFSVMANVTTESPDPSAWIFAHYRVNF